MYVIKMEDDKSLLCTIHAKIHQGEKHADTLVFVVPKSYDNVSLSECTMLMRYILPNGVGRSEELSLHPIPYNDNYYQYKLSVASRFTRVPGDITIWLTALNFEDEVVLKTGEIVVEVIPSRRIDDYLSDEDVSQIDMLAERVDKLQKEKADNFTYDDETRELQLMSGNELIGDVITVPSDKYVRYVQDTVDEINTKILDEISRAKEAEQTNADAIDAAKSDIEKIDALLDTNGMKVSEYVSNAIDALSIGDYAKALELVELAKRMTDAEADIDALEEASHTHENDSILSEINEERVAAWDAAEENAKTFASEELNEALSWETL